MSSVEWKDKYCLGIEYIDLEHRIFVSIIKKIEHYISKGSDRSYILRLMSELRTYASFHFQSEENTMIDINYPKILEHKKQHEKLLSQLQLLLLEIELGTANINELPIFLINWFEQHTITEDKKLAEFI